MKHLLVGFTVVSLLVGTSFAAEPVTETRPDQHGAGQLLLVQTHDGNKVELMVSPEAVANLKKANVQPNDPIIVLAYPAPGAEETNPVATKPAP